MTINRGCDFYGSMLAGKAQITIGDQSVFAGATGAGATLPLGGNTGDGVVVAASSMVTRDVAAFSIVAGNSARFSKTRELNDASAL